MARIRWLFGQAIARRRIHGRAFLARLASRAARSHAAEATGVSRPEALAALYPDVYPDTPTRS